MARKPRHRFRDWGVRTCARCKKEGRVGSEFGLRTVRGTHYPESECRGCKAERQRDRRRLVSGVSS